MKILYLTNLYPPYHLGGYELICASANRAMQARGHDTRVLTSTYGIEGRGAPQGEKNVERTLHIQGLFGNPGLGVRQLRGLELHNNDALRNTLAEFRPDVVHVFNLGGLSKSLAHTLQRAGVPTVYFVADHWIAQSLAADVWLDWWNRPTKSVAERAVRAGLEHTGARSWLDPKTPTAPARSLEFRRIYFCSRFLRDQAVSRGYDVGHAAVIHNSVDTKRFAPAPLAAEKYERLLFVGRLTKEKGVGAVLRAFARLGKSFVGSLTLCGRGAPGFEAGLRSFVLTHRLPVTFIEAEATDMPEIYRRHDGLLFASEWEEPFALPPLEAMACGLPVIATTTGGSAEIFRDNVNALTFKTGDDEDLARQIFAVHRDPELRRRIASTGCAQVRREFREETLMDRVEQYVAESVETWSGAALVQASEAGRLRTESLAHV